MKSLLGNGANCSLILASEFKDHQLTLRLSSFPSGLDLFHIFLEVDERIQRVAGPGEWNDVFVLEGQISIADAELKSRDAIALTLVHRLKVSAISCSSVFNH